MLVWIVHIVRHVSSLLIAIIYIFNKLGLLQIFAVRHYDEVDGDRRLSVSDRNFRVKIVLPVIYIVLFQLNLRFKGDRKL